MSFPSRKVCCDPLKRHRVAPKRGLRPVPFTILAEYPSLGLTRRQYICSDCRKELTSNHGLPALSTWDEVSSTCTRTRTPPVCDINDDDTMNAADESPSSESDQTSHCTDDEASSTAGPSSEKFQTDEAANDNDPGSHYLVSASDGDEMVRQLKEKHDLTTSRSERMRILTTLPRSWSIKQAARVFGVSRYLIRRAKQLVAEKGIMSSPNPKIGSQTLPTHTEEEIKRFYLSDDVSRVMPGKKDFVSVVQVQGKRVHQQKRLLLCNLREAYREFKERHPNLKIGFTKFAMLRPRESVLAGAGGTHSVCVCTIHQNVKLMIVSGKLECMTDGQLKHYRHCFATMQCNPPNIECYFSTCDQCPGN